MQKLDFSDLAQIKCTGGVMSNIQLKTVKKVIRNAGASCPSMKNYYYERQLFCDDVLECVQLDLEWSQISILLIFERLGWYSVATSKNL